MSDITLTEQQDHAASKNIELTAETPELDACGATANLGGKVHTCRLEPAHKGEHKASKAKWRRRSGDNPS